MFDRLGNFLETLSDWVWDEAEDSIPLERRLAQARKKRKEMLTGGVHDAAKMGEYAQAISQQRAELLVALKNTEDDIKAARLEAIEAQKTGDEATFASLNADARRLANEAGSIQLEITELDTEVEQAYKDFKDARMMIVELSRDIATEARGDMRLVAKVARTDLKERMLTLKENMLGLTTAANPAESVRQRAIEKAESKERYIDSRAMVVADLWEAHRGSRIAENRRVSSEGAEILAKIDKSLGFTAPPALPAPVVQKTAAGAL